jgi:hypothetical protein
MIGCLHIVVIWVGHQPTVKPLPGAPVNRILLISNRKEEKIIFSGQICWGRSKMVDLLNSLGNNLCVEMIMKRQMKM